MPGRRILGLLLISASPKFVEEESRQSNSKTDVSFRAHDEAAFAAAHAVPVAPTRGRSITKLF
jgi:hypothetical protein